MTSSQLSEWQAYDRLEPIGDSRWEFSMASLSSLIMNIARRVWGKKDVEMTSPDLFMPEWDRDPDEEREPVRQTTEQQKQIWLQIADIQNKRVKKEKEREAKFNKNPPKKRDKKK